MPLRENFATMQASVFDLDGFRFSLNTEDWAWPLPLPVAKDPWPRSLIGILIHNKERWLGLEPPAQSMKKTPANFTS